MRPAPKSLLEDRRQTKPLNGHLNHEVNTQPAKPRPWQPARRRLAQTLVRTFVNALQGFSLALLVSLSSGGCGSSDLTYTYFFADLFIDTSFEDTDLSFLATCTVAVDGTDTWRPEGVPCPKSQPGDEPFARARFSTTETEGRITMIVELRDKNGCVIGRGTSAELPIRAGEDTSVEITASHFDCPTAAPAQ